MRSHRGFTLIEMAIVVAVLGLLATTFVSLTAAVAISKRAEHTRANLKESQAALVVYAMQYARLPCPADAALARSDASYGLEQRDPATGDCLNNQVRGVLPWRTLTIQQELVADGLDNYFTYRAAPGVTRTNALKFTDCDTSGSSGALGTAPYQACVTPCNYPACTPPTAVVNGKGIPTLDTAGNTIANPALGQGAAYVLIAHNDHGGAYGLSGALQSASEAPGAAEATNAANLPLASSYVVSMASSAPQRFDDDVRTLSVLGIAIAAGLGPRTH